MPTMPPHRASALQSVNMQLLETYWQIAHDIVEVIACSKPSELHKTLAQFASTAGEQQPFQTLTRGMAVKGIDSALSTPKTGDGAPLRWGQDFIVVSTFPKP